MTVYNSWATKPSQPVATLQAQMIYTIVQAGAWDILDWFVCLANETETESRLDWKSLSKVCADAGTGNVWTPLKGIEGNGSGYLDSNFTPSTDGTHIGLNDASYGFYSNLEIAGADEVEMSARSGAADANAMLSMYTDSKAYAKTHTSAAYLSYTVTNRKGCYIANRVEANKLQYWKDNVKLVDSTQGSQYVPDATIKLLSYPSGLTGRSHNQLSFAFAGKGLTPAQIAAITSALQTYLDGVFF